MEPAPSPAHQLPLICDARERLDDDIYQRSVVPGTVRRSKPKAKPIRRLGHLPLFLPSLRPPPPPPPAYLLEDSDDESHTISSSKPCVSLNKTPKRDRRLLKPFVAVLLLVLLAMALRMAVAVRWR
ncbi:hypothetical protein FRB99_007179 [Tulasnella sp. 403]|nr:hypothetical protein FRB99_007179 [Tulasnella sp. 403]